MKFPIRIIPDDTNLPFMKWARIRTPISLALIVLTFVLFFTVGVNEGIDFKGGTVLEVHSLTGAADVAKIRGIVDGLGFGDVQIQSIGSEDDVLNAVGGCQLLLVKLKFRGHAVERDPKIDDFR